MFHRMDMLINQSGDTIKLTEVFHLAPPGHHGCTILLPPGGHHHLPAEKFYSRNRISGRPSTIFIDINGVRAPQSLNPHQFMNYVRISFYVDHEGRLTVAGVEPRWRDFCWFWGMGCLGSRHYRGRREVIIA